MDCRSHFSLFTHNRLRNARLTSHHPWGPRSNTSAPYRILGQLFSGEFEFSTTRAGEVIAWSYSSCQGCKPSPVVADRREAGLSQSVRQWILTPSALRKFSAKFWCLDTWAPTPTPIPFSSEQKQNLFQIFIFFSLPHVPVLINHLLVTGYRRDREAHVILVSLGG